MTTADFDSDLTSDHEQTPELTGRSPWSATTRRLPQRARLLPHGPAAATWLGVAITTAGIVLITVAWGRTAALTNVALQVPYVISAGFTGLALVIVGLVIVNVSVKTQISRERTGQLTELRELIDDLRRAVDGEER